jgi:hypothetical protein
MKAVDKNASKPPTADLNLRDPDGKDLNRAGRLSTFIVRSFVACRVVYH